MKKKVDGETEARLISIACSEPPKRFGRWSLRLLTDRMVELNYVDQISYETVRKVLKNTNDRNIHGLFVRMFFLKEQHARK